MDIDEALIEQVKANECLFDLSSASYKNVAAKEKIWSEIGRRLRLDGGICKKRWKTLRDTYRRNKRSQTLASGSEAPPGKRLWRYHESMTFLDGVQSYRKTTRNMVKLEEEGRCDSPAASAPPLTATPLTSPSRSLASPSRSLPSPLSSLESASARNTPPQELRAFLDKIADSVKEAAQMCTQRTQLPAQTPVGSYFAGLAHMVDGAKMPEELVQTVLHDAHVVVFNALREWSSRKNKGN